MTTGLISIDPGAHTGVARFAGGFLSSCYLGEPRFLFGDDVVIEKPQIYRASKSKGDPNDLIDVAIQVGELRAHARLYNVVSVLLVLPADWKGQVPKGVHHKRVRAALRGAEVQALETGLAGLAPSLQHNVLDAVGLGLWRLCRLGRGGT